MAFYTKKPSTIQAIQWTGANSAEIAAFYPFCSFNADGTIGIQTIEGLMTAPVGAWIVKGIKDEFYFIQDDLFQRLHFMGNEMTRDDVMRETLAHVRRVGSLIAETVVPRLVSRAIWHDDTKFSREEFDTFAAETPTLRGLTYGSPEYKEALARLGPALKHHYANNDHHPEFHKNGIKDMDLIQLIELLADWKAATERHTDGSLFKSITGNATRFNYDVTTTRLLLTTALNLKWLDPDADKARTYLNELNQ